MSSVHGFLRDSLVKLVRKGTHSTYPNRLYRTLPMLVYIFALIFTSSNSRIHWLRALVFFKGICGGDFELRALVVVDWLSLLAGSEVWLCLGF